MNIPRHKQINMFIDHNRFSSMPHLRKRPAGYNNIV